MSGYFTSKQKLTSPLIFYTKLPRLRSILSLLNSLLYHVMMNPWIVSSLEAYFDLPNSYRISC